MALTDEQLAILKTELTTDPMALGYSSPPTTNDPADAELINTVGLSGETIPNTTIAITKVMDAIVPNELSAVPTNELLFFLQRMNGSIGSIDISPGSPVITQISQTFTTADAPLTRDALVALTTKSASRAEVLFGNGVTVTATDVGQARQLP